MHTTHFKWKTSSSKLGPLMFLELWEQQYKLGTPSLNTLTHGRYCSFNLSHLALLGLKSSHDTKYIESTFKKRNKIDHVYFSFKRDLEVTTPMEWASEDRQVFFWSYSCTAIHRICPLCVSMKVLGLATPPSPSDVSFRPWLSFCYYLLSYMVLGG